jgi:20S proteasome alpha/beta subunit
MTLIAAVRCVDGFVIAADAQETFGNYRRAVQKIAPLEFGDSLKVIVAGSGNAALIESFIVKIARRLSDSHISDISHFSKVFEDELVSFHGVDVRLCPDQDRSFQVIVAASLAQSGEFDVWVSENVRLRPISHYELIGWDASVYHNVIQRLCHREVTLHQGVLIAVYTLMIAKETCNWVGGATSVAVIRENGVSMERPEFVQAIESRLKAYESGLNNVFLACADTSVSPTRLQDELSKFSEKAMEVHQAQLTSAVAESFGGPTALGDPYPKAPPGTVLRLQKGHRDFDS